MGNFQLSVGQPIPSFQSQEANGKKFVSDQLRGHYYVLYFYPRDDTSHCTAQACSFRDAKPLFDQMNVPVIGISPDNADSHQRFITKYHLNYTLITDPNHQFCDQLGLWQRQEIGEKIIVGVVRTTLIIDDQGIIRSIESPAQVEGHAERVLKALNSLLPPSKSPA